MPKAGLAGDEQAWDYLGCRRVAGMMDLKGPMSLPGFVPITEQQARALGGNGRACQKRQSEDEWTADHDWRARSKTHRDVLGKKGGSGDPPQAWTPGVDARPTGISSRLVDCCPTLQADQFGDRQIGRAAGSSSNLKKGGVGRPAAGVDAGRGRPPHRDFITIGGLLPHVAGGSIR